MLQKVPWYAFQHDQAFSKFLETYTLSYYPYSSLLKVITAFGEKFVNSISETSNMKQSCGKRRKLARKNQKINTFN